jgi:putative membrane protein
MNLSTIPTVNATLNGLATVFLFLGWLAVRRGDHHRHMQFMLSALGVSTVFLAFYLYYHFNIGSVTRYHGAGFMRGLYLFILFTHIPLAMVVVPGCLTALWHAWKKRFDRHVRVTRWLWPVWMYVSITGVLIYLMLYIFPHSL